MAWDRFHYICRRCHHLMASGKSLEDSLRIAETDAGLDLYGLSPHPGSLQHELLDSLRNTTDRQQALDAVHVYSSLDFSNELTESKHANSSIAYLVLVLLVFIQTSWLFHAKIIPSLATFYIQNNIAPSPTMLLIEELWHLQVIIPVLALGITITLSLGIKRLYQFKTIDGWIYNLLLPRGVKKHHKKLTEIIKHPLQEESSSNTKTTNHLTDIKQNGMDVTKEIQSLLRITGDQLQKSSDRHLKAAISISTILIILSITVFLSSTYEPIFKLGTAV